MDKWLVVLCAFVFGSALALAQSSTTQPLSSDITLIPLSKLNTEQAKAAARAAAEAKWDKMTSKEKAAAQKKGLAGKRPEEITAMDSVSIQWEALSDCEKGWYGGLIQQSGAMHLIYCQPLPARTKTER